MRSEIAPPPSQTEVDRNPSGSHSLLSLDHECAGCSGCSSNDHDRTPDTAFPLLTGWRLAGVSLVFFIGPIILAILGAASVDDRPAMQLGGAIAGLLVGLVGLVLAAKWMHPNRETTS